MSEPGTQTEIQCEELWAELHRDIAASTNEYLAENEEDDD